MYTSTPEVAFVVVWAQQHQYFRSIPKQHMPHIKSVLGLLKKATLKLYRKKCASFNNKIESSSHHSSLIAGISFEYEKHHYWLRILAEPYRVQSFPRLLWCLLKICPELPIHYGAAKGGAAKRRTAKQYRADSWRAQNLEQAEKVARASGSWHCWNKTGIRYCILAPAINCWRV